MSGRAGLSGQRGEGERGQDGLVSETERERLGDGKRMTTSYLFLPFPLCCSCSVLFFPHVSGFQSWKQKQCLLLEIGRCLLVGQWIIFSLPVMKVATGVSALGMGGGERWAVYPPQGPAPHVFCLVCDL